MSVKSEKRRQRIAIELGSSYLDFVNIANNLNLKPASLARLAILIFMKENMPSSILLPEVKGKEIKKDFEKATKAITVRLNSNELTRLDIYSKELAFSSRGRAAVAIIRSFLTKEIQFINSEVSVLRESNSQLRAIGSNLNQITKRLNSSDIKTSDLLQLQAQYIGLYESILKHTKKVFKLINKAKNRGLI